MAATDLETSRLRASAEVAAEAVAELQGRLADALALEALRLNERERAARTLMALFESGHPRLWVDPTPAQWISPPVWHLARGGGGRNGGSRVTE
ncbi:hypothetical protein [Streptomyces sp. NPDC001137]|uniref:hypothetical protein n=1 Tax=Streptomyces sp. NPDC001137 TaxID=3154378 RepID=UPI003322DF92